MKKEDKIMLELAGMRGDMALISYYIRTLVLDEKAIKELETVFNRNVQRFKELTKDEKENTNNNQND